MEHILCEVGSWVNQQSATSEAAKKWFQSANDKAPQNARSLFKVSNGVLVRYVELSAEEQTSVTRLVLELGRLPSA